MLVGRSVYLALYSLIFTTLQMVMPVTSSPETTQRMMSRAERTQSYVYQLASYHPAQVKQAVGGSLL
jgi:hypothetical protein